MKLFLVLLSLAYVAARTGFGPGEQEWGYATVRPGAHMFWWLYYTTANVINYTERPLIIWLQGGPGVSSTGYGNFAELGPLDLNLKSRDYAWVKDANVMFVDNPVGTGWSYVENETLLVTKNRQIADDFLVLLQNFYKSFPEFIKVPLYILSESYGGKMSVEISLVIDQAIKAGNLDSNFIGVGVVDSWISPIDFVMSYAPFLLNIGAIDHEGHEKIMVAARSTKAFFDSGKLLEATIEWQTTLRVVADVTYGIDHYNILTKTNQYFYVEQLSLDEDCSKIEAIMNGPVKQALNLTVRYKCLSGPVYNYLLADFMTPTTTIVESLLNNTNIKVAVITGQLDFIVDTPGTIIWVDKLKWTKSSQWPITPRKAITVNNINEGYVKNLGNLGLYWVNRAGHMVPADNPAGMDAILKDLTNNYSNNVKRNEMTHNAIYKCTDKMFLCCC